MSETANSLHQNIEVATREWAALKPATQRVKELGITSEEALKQRIEEGLAVANKHGVTEAQITSWMFDREYTYSNGKKCKCAECIQHRKMLRAHLKMEKELNARY